jgi:DNA-binding NarL/FixJ family response regulator
MAQRQRILVANSNKYLGNVVWSRLIPEPEFEIVGLASDADEAVDMAGELVPHAILVDLSGSELSGLKTIEVLHAAFPNIPLIAFTPVSSDECNLAALGAGAAACLTISEIADMLLQILRNLIPIRSLVMTHLLNYS